MEAKTRASHFPAALSDTRLESRGAFCPKIYHEKMNGMPFLKKEQQLEMLRI
jgi:hypothetical protein